MSMWVRRNPKGRIEAAAFDHQPGFDEELPDSDPELVAFMTNTPLPEPAAVGHDALTERRARAFEREDTTDARVQAINLRTGA